MQLLYSELFKKNITTVTSLLHKKFPNSYLDINDIAHNALSQALTSLDTFVYKKVKNSKDPVRSWLFKIASNTWLLKYRAYKQTHSGYTFTQGGAVSIDKVLHTITDMTTHNSLDPEFSKSQIHETLKNLFIENYKGKKQEDLVKVMDLHFFQNETYEYIARDLDIPLGTVKSRIYNIKKTLQDGIASNPSKYNSILEILKS